MEQLNLVNMGLPPYSPDLNPCENCIALLKKEVLSHERAADSLDAFRQRVKKAVAKLETTGVVQRLCDSLRKRLAACLANEDYPTKY